MDASTSQSSSSPSPSSLPYDIKGSHVVDGVRYLKEQKREIMEKIRKMEVHDGDVFICGYWKSGNNWVRTIVGAIFSQDHLDVFENTPFCRDNHLDVYFQAASAMPRPAVFWSLLPYHKLPEEIPQKKAKVIYIVRNPKDVAVSYYHFHKALIPFGPWDGDWGVFIEAFLSGDVIHGRWYEHAKTFLEQHNDPGILFVKYEDLKSDLAGWIKNIAAFLGHPLVQEKIDRIANMVEFNNMKQNPNISFEKSPFRVEGIKFLRKGKVGDWKILFSEEQSERADQMLKALCNETGCALYSD